VRRMGFQYHRMGLHLVTDPLFGAAEASLSRSHIRQKWGSGKGSSRTTANETTTESFKLAPRGTNIQGLC